MNDSSQTATNADKDDRNVRDRSILVVGETLIDFLPERSGPLSSVEQFTRQPGGAPANVAVGLAKLGDPPWFWTRIGNDPFGEFLVETLRAYDLPTRFIMQDEEARTTLAFIAHNDDIEFSFYRTDTADTRFRVGTIPDAMLESLDWCYVGGVLLSAEPARTAMFDLVTRAADHGCQVVFDPNLRPELWIDTDTELTVVIREFLAHVDLLKATADELRSLGLTSSGAPDMDRIATIGPHTIAVTRGAAGATLWATSSAPWGAAAEKHDGYSVNTVDSTGGGDAFAAGLLAALRTGCRDFEEILAFANAVGALTTTAPGGLTAIPDRKTVQEFRSDRSS